MLNKQEDSGPIELRNSPSLSGENVIQLYLYWGIKFPIFSFRVVQMCFAYCLNSFFSNSYASTDFSIILFNMLFQVYFMVNVLQFIHFMN